MDSSCSTAGIPRALPESQRLLSETPLEHKSVKRELFSPILLRSIKKELPLSGYSSEEDQLPPPASPTGQLAELTEVLAQGLHASHYKKLKPFSGSQPVPQGEEGFELWKEHLLQCLQEWTCSEEVKRQRIVESLRSPASELLRLHQNIHPGSTARELVKVLSGHFEPYHDHAQMITDFRMSRQQEREKVSDFINRLQLSLSRLVYHQAILPEEVDSLRTSQLTRGLLPQHPLTAILKVRLIDTDMPVYDLLMLVKKYEAELQFSSPKKSEKENPVSRERALPLPSEASVGSPFSSSTPRNVRQCSNCKGTGHTPSQCRNTTGSAVNTVSCAAAPGSRKASRCKAQRPLVGPKSEVTVLVNGKSTSALFDTGSQVTIVYRSFYKKNLSTIPLQTVGEIELWGLNPSSYPVDGSIPLEVEIPGLHQKKALKMTVTAFVCPDPGDQRGTPVILGTNCESVYHAFQTFLKEVSAEEVKSVLSAGALQELCGFLSVECKYGEAYYIGKDIVEIPPGCERGLKIVTSMAPELYGNGSYILMETPEDLVTSQGWTVVPERKDWRQKLPSSSVLTVRNRSPHCVVINPYQTLARCYPVSGVNPYLETYQVEVHGKVPKLKLDLSETSLPTSWVDRVTKRLLEVPEVFSSSDLDVGCAKSAQHSFRLHDTTPFRERPRRVPPKDVSELRRTLTEMKGQGIIVDSKSPYASPIVLVRKKNGTIRLCVDYRTLNRRTIPDQYTLPRIEEALEALNGNCWFSVLDLKSGYYQVPMAPEDQEKTAFICPLGFYQFARMPQGLRSAPATFQRLMERVLGDLVPRECLVYLDDIIVFGSTLEEHEERLMRVLQRLQEEGLKLSAEKCKFFRTSVTYVGHIISAEGVATDPSKVEAVVHWPRPNTITELRSFLGFCGYYRRFVEGYSKVAKPLHDLLKDDPERTDSRKKNSKLPFGDKWTTDCDVAFNLLKTKLTNAPVLAYADADKPYVLHVDASFEGLGGVLHQEYSTGLRPIAFVSRSLTPSERNYPVHKLEFLALKWAIIDKLHDYLYGAAFEVRTDNNPLTYLQTTAKLDATGHRWLAALGNYNFSVKYKPGRKNVGADALSRRPGLPAMEDCDDEWVEIPGPGVRAICHTAAIVRNKVAFSELRLVDCMGSGPEAIPALFACPITVRSPGEDVVLPKQMTKHQKQDPEIGPLYQAVLSQDPDALKKTLPLKYSHYLRDWDKFSIKDGVLYRVIQYHDHPGRRQLVLPKCFQRQVFRNLHDQHGHLGPEKTYGLIVDRFYWLNMRDCVTDWCRRCLRCLQRKTLPVTAAPLKHLQSSSPMDLVCIDFLCIDPDSRGMSNVLVVTDHFTRYAQAFPTKNQTAATVAKVLWERYFIHYGLPHRIHSDQGRDFESKLIRELLQLLNIRKSHTTPYHPQGDALPERFNRTLLNMLGTLPESDKRIWSKKVESLVHAYNSTRHDSTGFSPYFLMFGREPRLPVDLQLGVSTDGVSHHNHFQYVKRLKETLKSAYSLAQAQAAKTNANNKRRYDLRVRAGELSVGDQVLLRNLSVRGKHKLADRWRSEVYTIVDKLPNLPVYNIRGPAGRVKAWHRNHLLPLPQASDNTTSPDAPNSLHSSDRTESRKDLPLANTTLNSSTESIDSVRDDWSVVPEVGSTDTPPPSPGVVQGSANDSVSPDIHLSTTLSTESEPAWCSSPTSPAGPSSEHDLLPQRVIRRGHRNRGPPALFTYDSLGVPTLYSQPQVQRVVVGMVFPGFPNTISCLTGLLH